MEYTHFLALMPLIIFLVLSLIFYGKGLVHIITIGYTITLTLMAIYNGWEVLFFMPLVGTGLIAIILFMFAMVRGDWL